MALPPIDMNEDLAAEDEELLPEEGEEDMQTADTGVDPMFAVDISEAFPDLDDAQIAALQRAVLTLIGSGGGMPPAADPMADLGGMPF